MCKVAQSKSQRFLFAFFCTACAFAVLTGANAQAVIARESRLHTGTAKGKLYFLPITLATFVPVSTETIKQNADNVLLLNSDDLTLLYRIISGKPGAGPLDAQSFYRVAHAKKRTQSFDNSTVRLRLDDGKQPPLLVDQQGVVRYGHREYSLTPLAFVQLDHFIASLQSHK